MDYDLIIAGAGLSGLSYIRHYLDGQFPPQRILLVDASEKRANDRTWSFWSADKPIFRCAEAQSWTQLGFATDGYEQYQEIDPYRYYTIHGADFYQEMFAEIAAHDDIQFVCARIEKITDRGDYVEVETVGGTFTAAHVLDSITRPRIDAEAYVLNFQNFVGWTIQTDQPLFDPEKPILMDFRVPQHGAGSFVYVLPYREDQALVEFTQFTPRKPIDTELYDQELRSYLKRIWQLSNFTILEEEHGSIPMTNFPFESRPSRRVFRAGTAGGDTKPTTGYTFVNVQRHVQSILAEIHQGGAARWSRPKKRFGFYDKLLLRIISERPELVKTIMSHLFRRQPMDRVLRFLDEDTRLTEEVLIFARLPWKPFLRAMLPERHRTSPRNPLPEGHVART
ncbi:MAG: lycopene cyclase family protein [Bacteroidota bacterium]